MTWATDLLLWCNLDPHPGRAQVVIVVLGSIAVLLVLGMVLERVLMD
jgi:hypothetical protein